MNTADFFAKLILDRMILFQLQKKAYFEAYGKIYTFKLTCNRM
jgi:hypothetical protein